MKKLSAIFLLVCAAGFCIACKGKNAQHRPVSANEYSGYRMDASNDTEIHLANDAAIKTAFMLGYQPQKAGGEDEAEFLSAAAEFT
jgi:hypothetical protein